MMIWKADVKVKLFDENENELCTIIPKRRLTEGNLSFVIDYDYNGEGIDLVLVFLKYIQG